MNASSFEFTHCTELTLWVPDNSPVHTEKTNLIPQRSLSKLSSYQLVAVLGNLISQKSLKASKCPDTLDYNGRNTRWANWCSTSASNLTTCLSQTGFICLEEFQTRFQLWIYLIIRIRRNSAIIDFANCNNFSLSVSVWNVAERNKVSVSPMFSMIYYFDCTKETECWSY